MKEYSMPIQICSTCGTSYPDAAGPPSHCPICEDERQFVSSGGPAWTTPEKLATGHVNAWRHLETGLFEVHIHPLGSRIHERSKHRFDQERRGGTRLERNLEDKPDVYD
jgi:hypothetical protein